VLNERVFRRTMSSAREAMSKRVKIIVVASALSVLAVLYIICRQANNAVYHGQGLQAWALQLNSPQPAARNAATAAFKSMGSTAVPGLVHLLETKDPGLRRRVWALAIKLPRKLRAAFFRDLNWPDTTEVHSAAAKALGVIGPDAQGAISVLARSLRDPARQVSVEAATALSRIGTNSVPVLIEALHDKEVNARHMAAYALGEIGPPAREAVPVLVGMLNETNQAVRASVAYSLSRIGPGDFGEIINVLEHGNTAAREEAAKVLLEYYRSLRRAAPALAKLAQDESVGVRQQALETFSLLREADMIALGVGLRALKDPSENVRLAGIRALGNALLPVQALVQPLAQSLKDPSAPVRAAAAQSLGALGPVAGGAGSALKALVEDNDEGVRKAASNALRLVQCPQPTGVATSKVENP